MNSYQYDSEYPGLMPGESYLWRVRINNDGGNPETFWSEIESFKITEVELTVGTKEECNL